jgi:hypothetical protein
MKLVIIILSGLFALSAYASEPISTLHSGSVERTPNIFTARH